jgi:hypothetical protein
MPTLRIQVPQARDRTAHAILYDPIYAIAKGPAVATSSTAYGSRHGNPALDPLKPGGHPPFGRYQLIHHERTDARQGAHYGTHLLLFEPRSGQALDAESFGRLGLLVYGGVSRRRTQGGVRVSNDMLEEIVRRAGKGEPVTLELQPAPARAWWQFWKPAPPPSEPVTGTIELPQPPDDELTLIQTLLKKAPRDTRGRAPDQGSTYDPDRHRDTHADPSWSRTDSGTDDGFRGRGGDTGGGGASGSWGDAPQRPGVDSAGRIVAGAAAVGAIAAAAALAGQRDGASGDSAGGARDDAGGGNAGSDGAGSGAGGWGDSGDSGPAASTSTTTSY